MTKDNSTELEGPSTIEGNTTTEHSTGPEDVSFAADDDVEPENNTKTIMRSRSEQPQAEIQSAEHETENLSLAQEQELRVPKVYDGSILQRSDDDWRKPLRLRESNTMPNSQKQRKRTRHSILEPVTTASPIPCRRKSRAEILAEAKRLMMKRKFEASEDAGNNATPTLKRPKFVESTEDAGEDKALTPKRVKFVSKTTVTFDPDAPTETTMRDLTSVNTPSLSSPSQLSTPPLKLKIRVRDPDRPSPSRRPVTHHSKVRPGINWFPRPRDTTRPSQTTRQGGGGSISTSRPPGTTDHLEPTLQPQHTARVRIRSQGSRPPPSTPRVSHAMLPRKILSNEKAQGKPKVVRKPGTVNPVDWLLALLDGKVSLPLQEGPNQFVDHLDNEKLIPRAGPRDSTVSRERDEAVSTPSSSRAITDTQAAASTSMSTSNDASTSDEASESDSDATISDSSSDSEEDDDGEDKGVTDEEGGVVEDRDEDPDEDSDDDSEDTDNPSSRSDSSTATRITDPIPRPPASSRGKCSARQPRSMPPPPPPRVTLRWQRVATYIPQRRHSMSRREFVPWRVDNSPRAVMSDGSSFMLGTNRRARLW
jgi:hypothetical protein